MTLREAMKEWEAQDSRGTLWLLSAWPDLLSANCHFLHLLSINKGRTLADGGLGECVSADGAKRTRMKTNFSNTNNGTIQPMNIHHMSSTNYNTIQQGLRMRLCFNLRHNKVHKTIYLFSDIVYKFVKCKLIIKAQGNHFDYVLCSYFW